MTGQCPVQEAAAIAWGLPAIGVAQAETGLNNAKHFLEDKKGLYL
jgi:hypothetical protein